jgi:hypothetical protein
MRIDDGRYVVIGLTPVLLQTCDNLGAVLTHFTTGLIDGNDFAARVKRTIERINDVLRKGRYSAFPRREGAHEEGARNRDHG